MQPQRKILKFFVISKNVAHSLEPGETPRYSRFLNIAKHGEITTQFQFTGTATVRIFRQFNKDQGPVVQSYVKI